MIFLTERKNKGLRVKKSKLLKVGITRSHPDTTIDDGCGIDTNLAANTICTRVDSNVGAAGVA